MPSTLPLRAAAFNAADRRDALRRRRSWRAPASRRCRFRFRGQRVVAAAVAAGAWSERRHVSPSKGTDRCRRCLKTVGTPCRHHQQGPSMFSRLTAVSAAAVLAGGVGFAVAQSSSGSAAPGSHTIGAANTRCWDKATSKVQENVILSGSTTTGSTPQSGTSGNTGTNSTSAAGATTSSSWASGSTTTRPPGVRDCVDD